MNENNRTKILLAFVAGAAVGAAIGYFLNSDKKEEVLTDLKESGSKLIQDIEENLGKVKEMVENFRKNTLIHPLKSRITMEREPIDFFQELKLLVADYLSARLKLIKYEVYEKTAKIAATLFSSLVIAMLASFLLFFLSITLGFYFVHCSTAMAPDF